MSSMKHTRLNALQIAAALNLGEWVVYGVKKANRIFAENGKEDLIFTGRYSSPAKVMKWLDEHPDFVANQVLAPVRKAAKPKPPTPLQRLPV